MNAIGTLVVEDEPHGRALIVRYVREHPRLRLEGEVGSGWDAVALIERLSPGVLLLDIEIPGLDGFGVLAELERRAVPLPIVVFVTAYDRYAVRAFDIHAADYLLKPVSRERFDVAIDRCLARTPARASAMKPLLEDALYFPPERLLMRERGKIIPVAVADIEWIEAQGDYVQVYTGGKSYLFERTVADIAELLAPKGFARIHRGAIVNTSRIAELRALGSGRYELRLIGGQVLTVSRSYSQQFRR